MALQDDTPLSREWNYHPDIPLENASIFRWPPDPKYLENWFRSRWLMFSERVMMVLLAIAMWTFGYSSLDRTQEFSVGWVLQTWLANLVLVAGVAGGLHWYFYTRRGQGRRLKFDRRDQAMGNRLWDFSSQVHDNMFWSLTSGVAQLTAFQVLIIWAMANGHAPTITFAENPIWFLLALYWCRSGPPSTSIGSTGCFMCRSSTNGSITCTIATSISARGRAFPCIRSSISST